MKPKENIHPIPSGMRFHDAEGELTFTAPREIIQAHALEEVAPALLRVQTAVDSGLYAAGLLAYEAAPAFDASLQCHPPGDFPLLYFGLYDTPSRLAFSGTVPDVDLPKDWKPLLSELAYRHTVEKIRDHIAAGDTYQVNYTFPLEAEFTQNPDAVFDMLCEAQGKPKRLELRACIHTNRYSILSLSPEIFFTLDQDLITVCPMKGTRPRGRFSEEDQRLARDLRESAKDRAENLMIVDLLRNDLGRIAKTGSVEVRDLFQVSPWSTVWQMCSTIEAQTEKTFLEILGALFPSGSVTGAPKVNTMRLIKEYEPYPRGVYCGTMGYITPHREACFNVAIRTLTVDRELGRARYPIGSGITWESSARDEYQECLDKARVLQYRRPDFSLLETMRAEGGGIPLLELHLNRMRNSAQFFGIPLNENKIREALLAVIASSMDAEKLRLLVSQAGDFTIERHPIPDSKVWHVALAHTPVHSDNVFLYHKTTHRNFYDLKRAGHPECDDVLLWNERGELTESTFANIVLEMDGVKYTPPVSCGLLGGVYRQKLLDEGVLTERILYKQDIQAASKLWLINAVRGWIETTAPSSALPE